MVAHEPDNVFRDHLFRGEVRAVEARQVVAPETGRGGDAIGKIIEGVRVAVGNPAAEARAPRRRALRPRGSCARPAAHRAQAGEEPGAEQGAASRRVRAAKLVEQLRRGDFLALPLVEQRLLRGGKIGPAQSDACAAALQRLDDAARRAGCRPRIFSLGQNRSRPPAQSRCPASACGAGRGAPGRKLGQRWFAGSRATAHESGRQQEPPPLHASRCRLLWGRAKTGRRAAGAGRKFAGCGSRRRRFCSRSKECAATSRRRLSAAADRGVVHRNFANRSVELRRSNLRFDGPAEGHLLRRDFFKQRTADHAQRTEIAEEAAAQRRPAQRPSAALAKTCRKVIAGQLRSRFVRLPSTRS